MSTDHQHYSLDYQACAIRHYAQERGFEIVRTYADAGRSGLNLQGRPAMRRLLADVAEGGADFEALLVYDVSRLGRFLDPDEAAAHELGCRKAGIAVHYCAEPFDNDGSIASAILKSVKRVMAGEYSRELSVKVHDGCAFLAGRGFRVGGIAGFGLRRLVVDKNRLPRILLGAGETKAIDTDRIILVPGPAEEVAIVREIYALFVDGGMNETEIAALMNERGLSTHVGRPWRRHIVREILTNEKYVGRNVWGRTSFKLKQGYRRIDPAYWVRADSAFEPIVDARMYRKAQTRFAARANRLSDAQVLAVLRMLLARHGKLDAAIIDACPAAPSHSTYVLRFGSLNEAYARIGYAKSWDYDYVGDLRRIRRVQAELIKAIRSGVEARGGIAGGGSAAELIVINEELTLSVAVLRCFRTAKSGALRWTVKIGPISEPRLTLLARMAIGNQTLLDYFLLPDHALPSGTLRLSEHNGLLDVFRHADLDLLFRLAERVPIGTAG